MKTYMKDERIIKRSIISLMVVSTFFAPHIVLGATREGDVSNAGTQVALLAENVPDKEGRERVFWERTAGNDRSIPLIGVGMLLMVCAGYIIVRSLEDEMDEAERYAILEDIIEGKDA